MLGAPTRTSWPKWLPEPRTTASPGTQVARTAAAAAAAGARRVQGCAASTARCASAFDNLTPPHPPGRRARLARPGQVRSCLKGSRTDEREEHETSCVSAGSVLLAQKVLGLGRQVAASWLPMLTKGCGGSSHPNSSSLSPWRAGGEVGDLKSAHVCATPRPDLQPRCQQSRGCAFTTFNSTKTRPGQGAWSGTAAEPLPWPHRSKWKPTFEASQPEAY